MMIARRQRPLTGRVIPIASAIVIWTCAVTTGWSDDFASRDALPPTTLAETVSELDGERQPLLYWLPPRASDAPTPLFVFLHSWSSDYKQDNSKWFRVCVDRGWIWLHPNFRGVNESPKACGSRFARQDVLDAIAFITKRTNVDRERIYLAGVSGGGHMSLVMAAHHPEQFSAVSAWVGPTDLADWYRFHSRDGKPTKYAQMVAKSMGGPPGSSPEVDREYFDRSSVHHLHRVGDLPVSIWSGIDDGHTGSVPVSHSLRAFNAIARGHGDEPIDDAVISQLDERRLPVAGPDGADRVIPGLDRTVHFQRTSGASMVTIFEGGHESIPEVAFRWLEAHRREGTVGRQER